MHGSEGACGQLHGNVVARVQSEDSCRGRITAFNRLAGKQEPASELVAEALLRGSAGGRTGRLLAIATLVEEAVRELVGHQEPPAPPIEALTEAPVDVVPTPSRSRVDRNVELITVDRDQQGLRPTAIRVEPGAVHRESMTLQPRLEIPQRLGRVVFGQGLPDPPGDELRGLPLGT